MSRKSRPYHEPYKSPLFPTKEPAAFAADTPAVLAPVMAEPCHRCGGTGVVIRYRMDGSVKRREVCPCQMKKER